jgi:hypothetical protein
MSDHESSVESKLDHVGADQGRHQHAAPHDLMSAVEVGLVREYVPPENALHRWVDKLEGLAGIEARGFERVHEDLKAPKVTMGDYVQMCLVWLSANLTANNMMIGMLGPLSFGLGLVDGMLLATFGALCGGAASSYIGSFGPVSGNRTLVCLETAF